MHKESDIRLPLILGDKSYKDITDDVIRPIEASPPKTWYILLMISIVIALWGIGCIIYLLGTGVGTWGLNKTVGWAWDITNFVWWVGIGHAGTLISAVLLIFRQKWSIFGQIITECIRTGLAGLYLPFWPLFGAVLSSL